MSAVEQMKPAAKPSLENLPFHGRIERTRIHDGKRYTVIATPAPDPYSKGDSYVMRSKSQLGTVGEIVTVYARMSGYVRQKEYKNKDTGEINKYDESNVYFDVIE